MGTEEHHGLRMSTMLGKTHPFVTVVVPVYESWDSLVLCLECLDRQTYPVERYEVLVIDNGSQQPLSDRVQGPRRQLLCCAKPGSYAARNVGIRQARGDVIAFTDSDCIPDKEWLVAGVARLRSAGSDSDAVAGRVALTYGSDEQRTSAECYESAVAFDQERSVEVNGRAATANLFVEKRVVVSEGLFNEDVKSGADTLMTKRLTRKGYQLRYANDAVVWHPARSRMRDLCLKARRKAGARTIMRDKGMQRMWHGLLLLRPPLRVLWRILIAKEVPLGHRIRACFVAWILRATEVYEWANIVIRKKEPIR